MESAGCHNFIAVILLVIIKVESYSEVFLMTNLEIILSQRASFMTDGCDVLSIQSRDQGEVLAEALKTMLCDGRQHDMQRAAAFIKRLATFSLCFGSAESFAGINVYLY